ncbi:MAG: aldo/keto reductase [Planctomycetota bacterium]|nr:aldo/keto reductase [Planctomycetota bacterium]
MPLTDYVTLGRSGLRVSPFCLGTMTFGEDWGWGSSVEDSNAIMDAYIDAGGNFLDTANIYTNGHSETIIGDHVGKDAVRRDRLVIATKFLGNMYPGDPNGGGSHRKAIVAACEQSLRRLQTEYIDLYWMHFWDHLTPIEETMRALDDLVTSGKIRYVGFSDTPAWKCAQAQTLAQCRDYAPIVALQIEHSLVERTVENELLPMARELGMGVTPWSPLKGGVLSGKYTRANRDTIEPGRGEWVKNNLTDRNLDILDVLVRIAAEVGASAAQVALAWVQARDGVTSTILGARTMEQLTDNLGALEIELSAGQTAALDEVSEMPAIFPQSFLPFTRSIVRGGTTVNGEATEPWALSPQSDAERW